MQKKIEEILSFESTTQAQEIIGKFCEDFPLDITEAREVFHETLKLLWFFEQSDERVTVGSTLFVLDQMWHTFILFTQSYENFCKEFFGKFIHHLPETQESKRKLQEMKQNPEEYRSLKKKELQNLYLLVYEKLGEETLFKWFKDFPKKFSGEHIDRRRFERYQKKTNFTAV